jgi:hypothetical protein
MFGFCLIGFEIRKNERRISFDEGSDIDSTNRHE